MLHYDDQQTCCHMCMCVSVLYESVQKSPFHPLLLLRPPYGQLEYTLMPCVFLHWAGLQAPGVTLPAIYMRYHSENREDTYPHPTPPGLRSLTEL